jgi:hypothetical protein
VVNEPWIRVRSSGPPRAVGAAQARAWVDARRDRDETPAEALRRAVHWVLRWGGRSPASPLSWEQRQALVRDVRRHFPHFAERAEALARAAGCGPIWNALADPASRAFALGLEATGGSGLRCVLPGAKRWLCREIESEGGYRSCGVTVPWLPANLAGLNEAGLCGAVAVEAPLFPTGSRFDGEALESSMGIPVPEVMAPGWLLLDQCLERCDRVERALSWCKRRPGGGRARVVFTDTRGDAAQLTIEGTRRLVSRPEAFRAQGSSSSVIHLDPRARTLSVFAPNAEPTVMICKPRTTGG